MTMINENMATSPTLASSSADNGANIFEPHPSRPPPSLETVLQASPAAPATSGEPPCKRQKKEMRPDTGPLSWCRHETTAVVYREGKCSECGRTAGQHYHCVVDRDPLILEAKAKGQFAVSNDVIGAMFADQMSLGSFGPDRRSKEASILDEMSAEQIANYTAEELVTLLVQRETVQQVIAESRGQARSYRPIPLARRQYPDDDRSWVPSQKFECQHKVCLACCQRGGEENSHEKAWVSLDAVLNDDVSPSLATGFSFSPEGTRPFVDANILKNMDYRVAPPGGGIG